MTARDEAVKRLAEYFYQVGIKDNVVTYSGIGKIVDLIIEAAGVEPMFISHGGPDK